MHFCGNLKTKKKYEIIYESIYKKTGELIEVKNISLGT